MAFTTRELINYLVTTLGNDATLMGLGIDQDKVFMNQAPEQVEFPYIIMQRQAAAHDYNLDGHAVTRHYMLIKAVNFGTDGGDSCRVIMDRVNELLDDQHPVFTNTRVLSMRQQVDADYVEVHPANVVLCNVGTMYTIFLGEN